MTLNTILHLAFLAPGRTWWCRAGWTDEQMDGVLGRVQNQEEEKYLIEMNLY